MKSSRICIMLIIVGIFLTACNDDKEEAAATEEEVMGEEEEPEFEALTPEEVRDIIEESLSKMEEEIHTVPDELSNPEVLYEIVTEDIYEPEKDTDKIKEVIQITKEKFEHLTTENATDFMVREYLYGFYRHLEGTHLHADKINSRFEIVDQTDDSFQVSFITLENESGYYLGSTYIVTYAKEGDNWLFDGYEVISAEERPLNLTFDDLKEYYKSYVEEGEFEEIDEVESNGETYLIVRLGDYYEARNVNDSSYNYDLVAEYNEAGSDDTEYEEEYSRDEDNQEEDQLGTVMEDAMEIPPDIESESLQEKLDPSDYTQYLGTWTDYTSNDEPFTSLTLKQEGDKVEISYSVVGPQGAWINDMVGEATFSSDGIATYEYDMNYYGESGTVKIELKENGIEVFQDDFDGFLLDRRQK